MVGPCKVPAPKEPTQLCANANLVSSVQIVIQNARLLEKKKAQKERYAVAMELVFSTKKPVTQSVSAPQDSRALDATRNVQPAQTETFATDMAPAAQTPNAPVPKDSLVMGVSTTVLVAHPLKARQLAMGMALAKSVIKETKPFASATLGSWATVALLPVRATKTSFVTVKELATPTMGSGSAPANKVSKDLNVSPNAPVAQPLPFAVVKASASSGKAV